MDTEGTATHTPLSEAGTGPVPHAVFSLESVKPREKFSLWKESVSCTFDIEADRSVSSSDIYSVVDTHMFGQSLLMRIMTFQQIWHRTEQIIARDGMDHFMIHCFEAGRLFHEQNNSQIAIGQTGLLVMDLSRELHCWCEDFTNLSLIIPRHLLTPYLRNPDNHHLRFLPLRSAMVRLLFDHIKSLKDMADEISFNEALDLHVSLATLLAACLNHEDKEAGTIEDESVVMSRRMLAQKVIEQNLHDPNLSVELLANLTSVSRSQLYEIFRANGGVKSFIQERRLKMAMRRLADPSYANQSIEQIGRSVGFFNASAFSQSFKKRFDFTPRAIRSTGHRALFRKQNNSATDRRYEDWLGKI